MVRLRDDDERVESENLLRPHDRVERAEARVVADDLRLGNARLHERRLHVGRLVVCFDVVVAAHDEAVHLARLVELRRRHDPPREVEVGKSVGKRLAAAEHHARAQTWKRGNRLGIEHAAARREAYGKRCATPRQERGDDSTQPKPYQLSSIESHRHIISNISNAGTRPTRLHAAFHR